MDSGEVLQPYSTDEGGEPQGFASEAATISTGGKEEAAGRIERVAPERDSEPDPSGQRARARLTELAKADRTRQFSSIAHLLTPEALCEAFRRLKKKAAEGVDEVTYQDYEKQAPENIQNLWERLRSKTYRAQPLRRIYVDKEDGRQRAISIPSLEDKIVQKACVELLNAIFEVDFLPCSYGSRPGRHSHLALDEVDRIIFRGSITQVLELDIVSYFDAIVREQLVAMIERRVTDRSILQLIGKWINVGVIEDGRLLFSETGVGQGQVVSPLLANAYLHHVLDRWFEKEVRGRLKGKAYLVRYMDDAVICFQRKEDAQKVLKVLEKRMGRYGLTLHPHKTRLVEFGRSALRKAEQAGTRPKTFDLLGFTHVVARSRQGQFTIQVRTMKKRLRRGLTEVAAWCKAHRHQPVGEQCKALNAKLRGHYQYYGRPTNYARLRQFHRGVVRLWKKWLARRSRGTTLSWDQYTDLLQRHPLMRPKITHAYASLGSP